MTSFWIGLLIGGFFGTLLGIFISSLCQIAASADRHIEEESRKLYVGYKAKMDAEK